MNLSEIAFAKFRISIQTSWIMVALLFTALGSYLRITNIENKVAWFDEVYSSLHASGHPPGNFLRLFPKNTPVPISEALKYQRPSEVNGAGQVLRSVEEASPNWAPLFFLISWPYAKVAGAAPEHLRIPTALLSLLIFPALIWISHEARLGARGAALSVILFSVSPFHLLYAQEARPYALWTLLLFCATASFLRALQLNSRVSWFLYSLFALLLQLTHLLSLLILAGQAATVLLLPASQRRAVLRNFIASLALAGLISSPWFLIMLSHLTGIYSVSKYQIFSSQFTWSSFWTRTVMNFTCFLIDPGFFSESERKVPFPVYSLIAGIVCCALFFVRRAASRVVSTHFIVSALVFYLPLAVTDLALGGTKSITPRYLIPLFLILHLSLIAWVEKGLASKQPLSRSAAVITLPILVWAGLSSCMRIHLADTWWNKGSKGLMGVEVVRALGAAEHPLIVSSASEFCNLFDLIAIAPRLERDVTLQLLSEAPVRPLPASATHVLFFNLDEKMAAVVEPGFIIKELQSPGQPWVVKLASRSEEN